MTSRLRFLLALLPMLAVAAAPPRPSDEVQPEPLAVNEPFAGKLRLSWKVVRPDKAHWSLTKNKGKLTITTQKGSIHKKQDPNAEKVKNLFLIGSPYGRDRDHEVSVCVSDFEPESLYHQGGLMLYDDDDNYLKFVWESKGARGSTHLVLLREIDAKSDLVRSPAPENKGKVWLRLTRRGQKYEFASSGDGKEWTTNGDVAWGDRGLAWIGLTASHGPTEAAEIDVCFSEFRVRLLTQGKE